MVKLLEAHEINEKIESAEKPDASEYSPKTTQRSWQTGKHQTTPEMKRLSQIEVIMESQEEVSVSPSSLKLSRTTGQRTFIRSLNFKFNVVTLWH